MIGIFCEALRTLRQAGDISQAALATRMYVSTATVGHLETGHVRATPEHAAAADRALGTTPLLTTLLGIESEDDTMRRRALLHTFGAAAAVTATVGGLSALGEVLRIGLHEAVAEPADWQPILNDFERRLVMDPSPAFGQSLTAQLVLARQAVAERRDDVEASRAAAHLSLLYGLWMGNSGQLADALNWYRTSTVLADHCGDPRSRAYALGRSASRGVYEGMPGSQVEQNASRALAVSATPSPGALEARAAMVHLAALRGDLERGRESVNAMRDLAERLPAAPAGPQQRAVSFHAYLECRTGSFKDAERAHEEAERELARVPLWLADSRLYWALALARVGDARGATTYAVEQLNGVPWQVHTLAQGVADLLREVPRGLRTDEVDQLRAYAGSARGPWETLT
jgi:transcriptional regulator with XRE-family HTH domain